MTTESRSANLEELVAELAGTDDAEARVRMLSAALDPDPAVLWQTAERLKQEADRALYQDPARAARWCADVVTLGTLGGAPTVVALGRMVQAALLAEQDHFRESLAVYDEAEALFRAHGDEVGWARAQIGRMQPCAMLGRYEEAIARAQEARAILERAGDSLRAAGIDSNLALLLERLNRPAEALVHSARALETYRSIGEGFYAARVLTNHALLLWRVGRVNEALEAHRQGYRQYIDLGATIDAARESRNIGNVHMALGYYAEAVSALTEARQTLLATDSLYLAAAAGLSLIECFTRLGRHRQAVQFAPTLHRELARYEGDMHRLNAYIWHAQAHANLGEYDAALRALDAAALVAADQALAAHRPALDVARARLLLECDQPLAARDLLRAAIPQLREAGLALEEAGARVLWGNISLREDRLAEALSAADEALALARREGLDWLAACALHLHGRAAMHEGQYQGAQSTLSQAVRCLDRVHRHVAWDDRATFSGTVSAIYEDAVRVALRLGSPATALCFAERAKARALADHLRLNLDLRPRARDERSAALLAEMTRLRERYAWLVATSGEPAAEPAMPVRWAGGLPLEPSAAADIAEVERRLAEIWRDLQAANPAYRGDAAALDPRPGEDEDAGDEEAARRWVDRLQVTLGPDANTALVEYFGVGDDLILFVLRAGTLNALHLEGAAAQVRRLVALLRLNVERSAAAIQQPAGVRRALQTNGRGILQRLHAALLDPAGPLLEGVTRLVVVPHGPGHHVPFHALFDGRRYLLEPMAISYAPCASLLAHFVERHSMIQADLGPEQQGLVLACSNGGTLPHVVAEGHAVAAALGVRLRGEEEATLSSLRDQAGNHRILHLAAHAAFRPEEPLFSALQLADGRLTTLEVFDLELRCSLVTLSACETALGVAGAGDELMGLSRAFLYAGAPSLVLSVWKVEDRSTAALMERFYHALSAGAGKAAALRRAQLALLHQEAGMEADWSAPFYWAPFQLIGHDGSL